MGGINTFYTPGAVHTDVSGQPAAGPMGGGNSFFMEMARRKQAQQDQERANAQQEHDLRLQAMRTQMAHAEQDRNASHKVDAVDPRELHLKNLRMADEEAQIQARQSAAPMHLSSSYGQNVGYTPDTNAMSGYQRKIFLPESAGLANGGLSDKQAIEAAALAADAAADNKATAAMQAQSQNTNLPPENNPNPNVLTPSSSSGSPLRRMLTPMERETQASTNARYGR